MASTFLAEAAESHSKKITGTFIQFQSWMLGLDQQKWIEELDGMYQSKMDTIVIQWLKSDLTRFFPVHVKGNDPTETILNYADHHQMKVFLGLHFQKAWWTRWDDESFLTQTVKSNLSFAKLVKERYGHHPSFVGWYIPQEMSDADFDQNQIQNLRIFLKTFTSGLKKLTTRPLPVALSTFFERKLPPKAIQDIYSQILAQSGLDILMIQDGVGVHNWDTQIGEKITASTLAFQTAAQKHHIQTWTILENFSNSRTASDSNETRTPTHISRLKEQLEAHSSLPVKKVITFDFFHYMSPKRGEAQDKLFQDYLRLIQ